MMNWFATTSPAQEEEKDTETTTEPEKAETPEKEKEKETTELEKEKATTEPKKAETPEKETETETTETAPTLVIVESTPVQTMQCVDIDPFSCCLRPVLIVTESVVYSHFPVQTYCPTCHTPIVTKIVRFSMPRDVL